MLEKKEKNINDFKRKIVFAPNGFGKTVFSNYLNAYYEKKDKHIAFFTSKKISELVQITDEKIYFGFTAKLEKEKESIF